MEFFSVHDGYVTAPLFGWIDADRFGSFYLETFTNNYLLFILPNMFIAGSIIYALANLWKSTIISFVGALVIIMAYIISGNLISDIDNETIGALSDIFGIRAYSIYSKYYTPVEKNSLSPGFEGLIFEPSDLDINRRNCIICLLSKLLLSRKKKESQKTG